MDNDSLEALKAMLLRAMRETNSPEWKFINAVSDRLVEQKQVIESIEPVREAIAAGLDAFSAEERPAVEQVAGYLLDILPGVDNLDRLMATPIADYRWLKIQLIGWYGARAQHHLAYLVGAASSGDWRSKRPIQLIYLVGNPLQEILAAMEEAFTPDPPDSFWYYDVGWLGAEFGLMESEDFIDIIIRGAQHEDGNFRDAFITLYRYAGPAQARLRPYVEALLDDPEEYVRREARDVLGLA